MDDAPAMCVSQRLSAFVNNFHDVVDAQQIVRLGVCRERTRAVDMFGHHVIPAALFSRIVDRENVGMLQLAHHVGFVEKHLACNSCLVVVVIRLIIVNLDGDVTTVLRIMGQVDVTGAAAPDLVDNHVFADLCGDRLFLSSRAQVVTFSSASA